MITTYLKTAMKKAKYEILQDDKTFYPLVQGALQGEPSP
jgi:hypothetical protein